MKNSIIYLLSMLLLLASCSKNDGVKQLDEQAMISMSFNENTRGEATRALSFESDIKRVRVVMFRKDGVSSNYVFRQNEYFGTVASSKVMFDTFSGTYNIYYIINEPMAADGITPLDAYTKIKSVADIEALQLAYTTPVTSPYRPADVTMLLPEIDRTIVAGGNSYTISVVRALAKVYVDLIINESDFPAGEEVEITSVTLKGLPDYSFLVSKEYPLLGTFTDSETQTVAATSAAGVHTYEHIFYVPEYILRELATENVTIEITGKSKTSGLECKWSEPLGDKMDGDVVAHPKYDIRRNTEYQLIGNVKGYGDHEMFVVCKIEDWTETNIGGGLN